VGARAQQGERVPRVGVLMGVCTKNLIRID
jgi:hypothetical protein